MPIFQQFIQVTQKISFVWKKQQFLIAVFLILKKWNRIEIGLFKMYLYDVEAYNQQIGLQQLKKKNLLTMIKPIHKYYIQFSACNMIW